MQQSRNATLRNGGTLVRAVKPENSERETELSEPLQVAKTVTLGMPDPAVLLDRDLRVICYSTPYTVLADLRHRQLTRQLEAGHTAFTLVGDDPEKSAETARACMESAKAVHFAEETVFNQRGEEFTVFLTYLPVIGADGEAHGVIQSFRDVSAEARVQARYRELLNQERMRAENLEREVEKRTQELTAALEEVTRLSRVDPLTGLLNRRAFTELAEQALRLARRHGRSMGLLICDLDRFKKINDTHGHLVGDKVLVASSATLKRVVRESDPVARFGGEEFVVLLTETSGDSVSTVGERIRMQVEALGPSELEADIPSPTLSIGMSVYPEHGSSLDELISNADKALYAAKDSGRNRCIMFEPGRFEAASPNAGSCKQRLLLVGSDRAAQMLEVLGERYEVTACDDNESALAHCQDIPFDVLVADHPAAENGVEFLRRSQRFRPESLRVLVIETQEVFVEVRGSNLARVDSYLLRSEATQHLFSAIDDGIVRRDTDRQRLLMSSNSVRNIFSSRLQELDRIIEGQNLDFAYQPIVDPRTLEVFGYEALCRARHPIFRNPTVLFEAALQAGSLWALGRAVRQAATALLHRLPDDTKLFVNLHPGEVEDPELVSFGKPELASRLIFEITERASIPDFGRFQEMTHELVSRGFQFAIDDLGAGYASLNAVALLTPEFIKIDMAMVRGVHNAPNRARLIRRIVDFANDIGIRLIAEGIETEGEARAIAELGCHLAQGFFYGRPARID